MKEMIMKQKNNTTKEGNEILSIEEKMLIVSSDITGKINSSCTPKKRNKIPIQETHCISKELPKDQKLVLFQQTYFSETIKYRTY